MLKNAMRWGGGGVGREMWGTRPCALQVGCIIYEIISSRPWSVVIA